MAERRLAARVPGFDAITAARPYRGPVPVAKTMEIMAETVGTALDPACFEALRRVVSELEATAAAAGAVATPGHTGRDASA